MGYELVIFDLAGTTVRDNRDVHRVLQSALRRHNVCISIEEANRVMGIPKPVAIRALMEERSPHPERITEAWIDHVHHDFVLEMIRFYETDPAVGEKSGVSETFRELKHMGIKVVVDTGFDRPIVVPLLARLGWLNEKLLDGSVTSDEVPRGRPYPDMIFEAMRRVGVSDAGRVVKVGDTVSDMQEGHAAGCGLVVGVTSGACSAEVLKVEQPHHLIKELPELLHLL